MYLLKVPEQHVLCRYKRLASQTVQIDVSFKYRKIQVQKYLQIHN